MSRPNPYTLAEDAALLALYEKHRSEWQRHIPRSLASHSTPSLQSRMRKLLAEQEGPPCEAPPDRPPLQRWPERGVVMFTDNVAEERFVARYDGPAHNRSLVGGTF